MIKVFPVFAVDVFIDNVSQGTPMIALNIFFNHYPRCVPPLGALIP
jgi:hypothetical protein